MLTVSLVQWMHGLYRHATAGVGIRTLEAWLGVTHGVNYN